MSTLTLTLTTLIATIMETRLITMKSQPNCFRFFCFLVVDVVVVVVVVDVVFVVLNVDVGV